MNPLFAKLINRASQLTRRGRLMDATAAIQRALSGVRDAVNPRSEHNAAGTHADAHGPIVLDGLVTELNPSAARDDVPVREAPAQFTTESYASETGLRNYKLFVPEGAAGRALPLVVMLHGCTQDPDDFAVGTRMNELAQERGFLVLYPQQAPRSNASKCWNWFRPGDQKRGRGEPALIAGMTRHVIESQRVDADRVYVAGLSAGGAMAAILGREYADVYAAVGVHSGLPQGAAHDVMSAFSAMKHGPAGRSSTPAADGGVPIIVFHGDDDATVHPSNGAHVIADLLLPNASEASVSQDVVDAGHRFTRTVYRDRSGQAHAEHWEVHGAGHAWSGGSADGTYTDARGPDATREMARFFLSQRRRA